MKPSAAANDTKTNELENPRGEILGRSAAATGQIVACPDGPLLVRGEVEIISSTGEPLPRRRRTVALCRCGASGIKPYCDGTHKVIEFRTGPGDG